DSSLSRYCGRPLSVLRVMVGSARFQPKPKGPLPAPESYDSASCGPKPERPGLVAIGTVMEPVPVTGLAANFSPMPRIAPPPLGRDIEGGELSAFPMGAFVSLSESCVCMLEGNGVPRDSILTSLHSNYHQSLRSLSLRRYLSKEHTTCLTIFSSKRGQIVGSVANF